TTTTGITRFNVIISLAKLDSVPVGSLSNVYKIMRMETTNLQSSDISQVIMQFKVAKSWINSSGYDSSMVKLARYSDGAWHDLTTNKLSEDTTNVYYTATSPGFSYFAIHIAGGECIENWVCSDWSSCVDSSEVRNCYDSNSCMTTASKPVVSRICGAGIVNGVRVTSPVNGSTVGNSLRLQYNISGITPVNCSYILDDGTAVTIENCSDVDLSLPAGSAVTGAATLTIPTGLHKITILVTDDGNNTYSDFVYVDVVPSSMLDIRIIAVIAVIIIIILVALAVTMRKEKR
ncbi:MAG: PGF-pre-PGF domain-containing protein, partial [Candidatus Aenigmatarchaeota archaeon]